MFETRTSFIGQPANTRLDCLFLVNVNLKVHLTPNTISAKMQTLSCSKVKFFRATVQLEICYQLVHDRAGEGHGSIPDLTSQTDLHACSQRVNAM